MKETIDIALPKGRLGEQVYDMFERAAGGCPGIREDSRKLIFENPETGMRFFWVKPSDVAIYVERGAADIGVAGRDILLEYSPDVYELLDLGIGRCRMCVARKAEQRRGAETLRVATKFPNIATRYFQGRGPRHRHHKTQRLHRARAHTRPLGRHRGHRRDGHDAPGERPARAGDDTPHQRAAHRQQGEFQVQIRGHKPPQAAHRPGGGRRKSVMIKIMKSGETPASRALCEGGLRRGHVSRHRGGDNRKRESKRRRGAL